MARPLRIEYAGAIYHVTVRGNARQKIFRDDRDRRALCNRLAESAKNYGVRVYLYVLMDNHFHLVLETPRANLRRFMQSVLTGLAMSYNARHRRCGHLTQGRYGARLVAGDAYLLKLSRYVHLNPVQVKVWRNRPLAERLRQLRDYRWSSYRGYIGLDPREDWVEYEPMLSLASADAGRAGVCYERFVEEGLAEADEDFLDELMCSPRSIGDEKFRGWVDEKHSSLMADGRRDEDVAFRPVRRWLEPGAVLVRVAALWGMKAEELTVCRRDWPGRGLAAHMLEKYAGLTRRECAPWIGLASGMGVGYQIKQALARLKTDAGLVRQVAKVEAQFERESEK
jgi:REP element-mobilizing transposase RayT